MTLGLDAAERRTFLLLVAGHLLFVAALFTVAQRIAYGLDVIVPLFGLPLAVLGRGDRRLVRALVFVVGFGLVHYGAVYCAVKSVRMPFTGEGFTDSLWIPGATGGLIGAAGSFALCALAGLLRAGSRAMLAAGVAVLTAVGAVGVYLLMSRMGTTDANDSIAFYLFIYTPWQLAFAWFLAKLLRN